jgi:DNA-binding MarR family transcriptional regulator
MHRLPEAENAVVVEVVPEVVGRGWHHRRFLSIPCFTIQSISRSRDKVLYSPKMLDVKNLDMENLPMTSQRRDIVDERVERWLGEMPDLDARTEAVVSRIDLIQRYLRRAHDETLEAFGLTWGDHKIVGSLRYGGPPYRSTPGRLGAQHGLSSGAVTARLDKMEEAGLIRRLPDPDDRRGVIVELTARGKEVWERSVAAQADKESLVAATLGERDRDRLNALLRRLVLAFTEEYGPLSKPRS